MIPPILIDSGPSERGWHYYANFMRCPLLFFWKQIWSKRLGFDQSADSFPLTRGTLVHVALAHHYAQRWARENGRDPTSILGAIEALEVKAATMGPVGQEARAVARYMLDAYLQRYEYETFKVVAIEQPVEIKFGAALYTARLDRVVEEPDGRIYVHDIKTTARIESKVLRRYMMHGQLIGQAYLGRHIYGDRFGGVIIDVVDEKGECVRKPLDPAPFMHRAFPKIIEGSDEMIRVTKQIAGEDPDRWAEMASPDEQICWGSYGPCPALDLCKWGPTR